MYHFRLKISNTDFTNKSLSSCGDVICKQMDGHNELPLPSTPPSTLCKARAIAT